MATGAAKPTPPFVDFATKSRRVPVSGQNAYTSPKLLDLMSPPIPVPDVSAPLTCTGVCHDPLGPVRRLTNTGAPLCQIVYMLSLKAELGLWSTHIICLSVFVCVPE